MTGVDSARIVSFHGDPAIKTKYLERVVMHRAADALTQGIGWENGKGCAVGCTLEAYDHAAYQRELGVPGALAHLEDAIFEGLSQEDAMHWPAQFLEAIPVGADLWPAHHRIMSRVLREVSLPNAGDDERIQAAIEAVARLWDARAKGEGDLSPTEAYWQSIESAADYAEDYAAESAARSAAKSTAWSAARSAADYATGYAAESAAWYAAESATWSAAGYAAWSAADYATGYAAESAAWSATRSAAWQQIRDITIEELQRTGEDDSVGPETAGKEAQA